MGVFLLRLERKFGKLAISNLTLILIFTFIIGYVLGVIQDRSGIPIVDWITLNPYLILKGQVWRIVSWVFVPSLDLSLSHFLTTFIILTFFYYVGKSLENTWGDFRYTLYIVSGLLFTVVAAFILYGIAWIKYADIIQEGYFQKDSVFVSYGMYSSSGEKVAFLPGWWFRNISTFYVYLSIILAYAATFPEDRILYMMIIPIRAKIFGIAYGAFIVYDLISSIANGASYKVAIIIASVLNFMIFFFAVRGARRKRGIKSDFSRRTAYRRSVREAEVHMGTQSVQNGRTVITRHKCAICGKTELSGDNLEFRFCSKCDGNYEYCLEHLYSHEHIKRI